jgi:hyperosmotically inducible protein
MNKASSSIRATILLGVGAFISITSISAFAQMTDVKPIKNNVVAETPQDEAKVTNAIQKQLHSSKILSRYNLKVNTHKGVVTYEGTVDSDSQIISLIEIAESVVGVSDVDTSKIIVKEGTQPLTDSVTTAKIKGMLIREELFGEKDLAAMQTVIETKNGVVYITGIIDNKQQIDNAIELIKQRVPEVKSVEYHVKKITPTRTN